MDPQNEISHSSEGIFFKKYKIKLIDLNIVVIIELIYDGYW